jgi:hypothetical protein
MLTHTFSVIKEKVVKGAENDPKKTTSVNNNENVLSVILDKICFRNYLVEGVWLTLSIAAQRGMDQHHLQLPTW